MVMVLIVIGFILFMINKEGLHFLWHLGRLGRVDMKFLCFIISYCGFKSCFMGLSIYFALSVNIVSFTSDMASAG